MLLSREERLQLWSLSFLLRVDSVLSQNFWHHPSSVILVEEQPVSGSLLRVSLSLSLGLCVTNASQVCPHYVIPFLTKTPGKQLLSHLFLQD